MFTAYIVEISGMESNCVMIAHLFSLGCFASPLWPMAWCTYTNFEYSIVSSSKRMRKRKRTRPIISENTITTTDKTHKLFSHLLQHYSYIIAGRVSAIWVNYPDRKKMKE